MSHLLDANTCIDHLRRDTSSKVTTKLLSASPGSIYLCSVVVGELLFGARRSAQPAPTLAKVRSFRAPYLSLPFDDRAAEDRVAVGADRAQVLDRIHDVLSLRFG
ncbi:MAG: type II toxin-antitoxin system VapC family toxin [Gemmataceae bacterium]